MGIIQVLISEKPAIKLCSELGKALFLECLFHLLREEEAEK